ncbi:MAG: hypothetical protein AB1810_00625 [Pseudomonadota bacterium]
MMRALMLSIASVVLGISQATAGLVSWTDWQRTVPSTTVYGDMGGVGVTYNGNYTFVQLGTGTNYWTENGTPAPYTGSAVIDNAPTPSEMIALYSATTNKITFSTAVLNPVMAIVSMGQPGLPVSYDFDTPFEVLSNGVGYWSGANGWMPGTYFHDTANDKLTGYEVHAAIQFKGLVSELNWSSTAEYWHGVTFGSLSAVPAPPALALLGLGLLAMGVSRRPRC